MGFFDWFNRTLSPIFGSKSKIGQTVSSIAKTVTGGHDNLTDAFTHAVTKGGAFAGINEAINKGQEALGNLTDKTAGMLRKVPLIGGELASELEAQSAILKGKSEMLRPEAVQKTFQSDIDAARANLEEMKNEAINTAKSKALKFVGLEKPK
jgi:hypothetical protein